jgi:hypothetical protein
MTILTSTKTWRRPAPLARVTTPDLTPDEIANVKRALRVLCTRHGGWATLAQAMGTNAGNLQVSIVRNRKPSVAVALRAARVAGVPLEEVLSGAWPKPGACPHCGRV